MKIFVIVMCSILLYLAMRCIVLITYSLTKKILKISSEDSKFQLEISIVLFLFYLYIYCEVVQKLIGLVEIVSILDWFLIYTCMGISAILWCYFSWELKWKTRPKFGQNDEEIIVKKIVVFTIVMAFSFYYGYQQLSKTFDADYDKEKVVLIMISNATIIPGIIALDRVLNQVKSYIQLKKKKKE